MKLEIKKTNEGFVVQDETGAVYGATSTRAEAEQLLQDWKSYYGRMS